MILQSKMFGEKHKMLVNFSGGRTSAYMAWYLLNEWHLRDQFEFKFVFANTGKEVEGTYWFIRNCAEQWKIDITWIEYYPANDTGWSCEARVVDYKTASRNGEPFERLIEKIGIPSTKTPFCSTLLKARTIRAHMRDIGWEDYQIAIGIRADEIDRMNPDFRAERIVYPLIKYKETMKPEILEWWSRQPFDLYIHSDEGNCDNCWKKDMPLLIRNYKRNPKSFEWWADMTSKYGHFNPRKVDLKPPFNFYRGNVSPADIASFSLLPEKAVVRMSKRKKLNGVRGILRAILKTHL